MAQRPFTVAFKCRLECEGTSKRRRSASMTVSYCPRHFGIDLGQFNIFLNGGMAMKRLTVVSLACLLSACVSNPATLRHVPADRVADFPVSATALSACVHQATEALKVPYTFRLQPSPHKRTFSITATAVSTVITRRQLIGLEVQFIAQGPATTVHMRKGMTGGWWLAPKVWPLIERCSEQHAALLGEGSTDP
jgi:hypothetical protein